MELGGDCRFLLVFPDEQEKDVVEEEIKKHIKRSQFFFANTTSDAISIISIDRPHVVVSVFSDSNIDGYEILEYLLEHRKKYINIPIILVGDIPEKKIYIDEVVSRKLQFSEDITDEDKFSQCLFNALNFVTHNDEEPVNLRFISEGEHLLNFGDEPQNVFVVKSGTLEASVNRNGKRIVLGTINTGEFVGEMAYINSDKRSADVVALTDCELIEIPINMFDKVLLQRPSWSKALMKTLSKRMKIANEKLA